MSVYVHVCACVCMSMYVCVCVIVRVKVHTCEMHTKGKGVRFYGARVTGCCASSGCWELNFGPLQK